MRQAYLLSPLSLMLLFVSSTARADTITVCASGCDHTSLKSAINAASDGDVIELFAETYSASGIVNGNPSDPSDNGTAFTVIGVPDQDGDGLPETIIDGGGANRIYFTEAACAWENVIFQNARQAFHKEPNGFSTGGYASVLTNCHFRDLGATEGSGIYINGTGSLTAIDCTFTNCSGTDGGAVNVTYSASADVEFIRCVMTGNTAATGAAISIYYGHVTLTDCLLWCNSSNNGDQIYLNDSLGANYSTYDANGTTCFSDSCADVDGDGYPTGCDEFPGDPTEYTDTDGDGVGDNADPCPYDPNDDTDGDGLCDGVDDCPNDADNDADGDGVCGDLDAFPDDPNETSDADGDGVGDNGDVCDGGDDSIDTDLDGTPDACDAFPEDSSETVDSDGDGIGDNSDACVNDPENDADGDGLCANADDCPNDFDNDADGDGVCGDLDAFPDDPNESLDSDGDGVGDNADPCPYDAEDDADGDGVCADEDAFPDDPTETTDTDGDGIGDNSDWCPLDADNDADGDGFCADQDSCELGDDSIDVDFDGVADACDPCIGTPSECDGTDVITVCDWGCDYVDLQDAIDAVDRYGTIKLGAKTYYLTSSLSEPDDQNLGAGWDFNIVGAEDADGDGIPETILDGSRSNGRFIYLTFSYQDSSFSHLSFQNFSSNQGGVFKSLRFTGSSGFSVKNCNFENNTSNMGGVFYIYGNYFGEWSDCTFAGNSATKGGLFYTEGTSIRPVVKRALAWNNTGSGAIAYLNGYSNQIEITNGTFLCNDSFVSEAGVSSSCYYCTGNTIVTDGCVDTDADGIYDEVDVCPNDPDNDGDGDGFCSDVDAFPADPNEWSDTDGDGIGDNSDPDIDGDGVVNDDDDFPFDSTETVDSDGDGVGDNSDAYPDDPAESADSDGDGVGDNADICLEGDDSVDSDSDGTPDACDAFPDDPSESADFDGDGVGDNSDICPADPDDQVDDEGNCVVFVRTVCSSGCEFTSIQDAIDAASEGHVIDIGPGTYYESGMVLSSKNLTIRGAVNLDGSPATTIDAQQVNRVFTLSTSTITSDTVIQDLVITGGGSVDKGGGCLIWAGADPTLIRCYIEGNTATDEGGGVWMKDSTASFTDCVITNNSSDDMGGGFYLRNNGSPVITTTLICGNTPDQIDGLSGYEYSATNSCISDECSDCDADGDGVGDYLDPCPYDADDDIDGDGVCGDLDAFPNDPNESADSDGDGVGDNSDAFPDDPTEFFDSDGDGVGDNSDAFPDDPTESADSDGDGIGDNSDVCPLGDDGIDSDLDGTADSCDEFPNDSSETMDSDGDGVGDNSDAFPDDPTEYADSDGDGVGNNSDAFPDDPTESVDSDGDGLGDNTDPCPGDFENDADGDGLCADEDACPNDFDNDADGDGVCGDLDAFPDDPNESVDSDGDGVGDNADDLPDDPNEQVDSDGDGVGNNSDGCIDDPEKTEPGNCGCGLVDTTVFGDLDCDGDYDADDIRLGMAEFGIVEIGACAADINGDGVVDGMDLGAVLAAWGLPCVP